MRRKLLLFAVAVGIVGSARGTSLSCTLNNVVQNTCYSQNAIFGNGFDKSVNWLTGLGEAYNLTHSGPWATSNQAINVTLSSLGTLQRADNTGFAWDGSEWTLPGLTPHGSSGGQYITTFGGRFGAPYQTNGIGTEGSPSCATQNCATYNFGGEFGDDLVGVIGGVPLTITFSTPVTTAGFLINSRNLANFTATLQAFDGNNLLGTYAIMATGLGGGCTGLGMFSGAGNPQPCATSGFANMAPFIELIGQNRDISKLVVQTSDNTGFFIDQMYLSDAFMSEVVPEPATLILLGSGLCLFAWLLRRRTAIRAS